MRRFLINLLVMVGATVLSLGLAEIATRIFLPVQLFEVKNDVVQVSENPILMYELNPEHPDHNPQGFRDSVEYATAKRSGKTRIGIVGDSTTFGYATRVEKSFPKQLQGMLDESQPGAYEVLNFGMPGFSIIQELELLKVKVLDYSPDVVILAICLNDWEIYTSGELHPLIERNDLGGMLIDFLDPQNSTLKRALFNSHLYRRLLLMTKQYGSGTQGPDHVWKDGNPIPGYYQRQGDWYGKHFREFQEILEQRGIRSIVALLPMDGATGADLYQRRFAELRQYCDTLECQLVDVRQSIADAKAAGELGPERLFQGDEVHFTKEGNRAVAGALLDAIADPSDSAGASSRVAARRRATSSTGARRPAPS